MKLKQSKKIVIVGFWLFSFSAYGAIDSFEVSPVFGSLETQLKFTVTLSSPLPKNYKVQIDFGNGNLKSMQGLGTHYSFSQKIYNLTGQQNYVVGIYDSKGILQYRDSGFYTVKNETTNKHPDYYADFKFTKISHTGEKLKNNSRIWHCVKDNTSGLTWEIKTADAGLHDWRYTYSWYNPNNTDNGGDTGTLNGGSCVDNLCNTDAYVKAINSIGYCGHTDWRVPTVEELQGIVSYDNYLPSIDTTYFSDLKNSGIELRFWSSTPFAGDSNSAWSVNFYDGYSDMSPKHNNLSVRLVSDGYKASN